MDHSKEHFLKEDLIPLLQKLRGDEQALWGVMTAQQMIEHFADAVKIANGKLVLPVENEGEKLARLRLFMMSEEPFKENIKNPLLPAEGIAPRQPDLAASIQKLQKELNHFFEVFSAHPELTTANPFFGDLDYAMNIQLLHKHALHHLKQFGLV
jgi:hypothetical protein